MIFVLSFTRGLRMERKPGICAQLNDLPSGFRRVSTLGGGYVIEGPYLQPFELCKVLADGSRVYLQYMGNPFLFNSVSFFPGCKDYRMWGVSVL